MTHRPLRLRIDGMALCHNWRALRDAAGGVATGAAIKANGYGLGAREVMERLAGEGARDFFVATWMEADDLGELPEGVRLAVLHGLGPDDGAAIAASAARPVLNSVDQIRRWRVLGFDRPCDVMVDTGMNRLGLGLHELGALEGLRIDTLHSHLACADEPDHPMNRIQLDHFRSVREHVDAKHYSLANSAGILLGEDWRFDLVRPGIALYGGLPTSAFADLIEPVASIEAQVLQRRSIKAGESVGYSATYVADQDLSIAILNLGYADGFPRNMSGKAMARIDGKELPLLGRVSMDLVAIDASDVPGLGEGDWVSVDYDLPTVAKAAGISQYEALTGLGRRFERIWKD